MVATITQRFRRILACLLTLALVAPVAGLVGAEEDGQTSDLEDLGILEVIVNEDGTVEVTITQEAFAALALELSNQTLPPVISIDMFIGLGDDGNMFLDDVVVVLGDEYPDVVTINIAIGQNLINAVLNGDITLDELVSMSLGLATDADGCLTGIVILGGSSHCITEADESDEEDEDESDGYCYDEMEQTVWWEWDENSVESDCDGPGLVWISGVSEDEHDDESDENEEPWDEHPWEDEHNETDDEEPCDEHPWEDDDDTSDDEDDWSEFDEAWQELMGHYDERLSDIEQRERDAFDVLSEECNEAWAELFEAFNEPYDELMEQREESLEELEEIYHSDLETSNAVYHHEYDELLELLDNTTTEEEYEAVVQQMVDLLLQETSSIESLNDYYQLWEEQIHDESEAAMDELYDQLDAGAAALEEECHEAREQLEEQFSEEYDELDAWFEEQMLLLEQRMMELGSDDDSEWSDDGSDEHGPQPVEEEPSEDSDSSTTRMEGGGFGIGKTVPGFTSVLTIVSMLGALMVVGGRRRLV